MDMKVELGEIQEQFAQLIWEKEPIGSGELVKEAEGKFGKNLLPILSFVSFARRAYFKMPRVWFQLWFPRKPLTGLKAGSLWRRILKDLFRHFWRPLLPVESCPKRMLTRSKK